MTVTASLDARTKRPFVRPAKRVRMLPSRKPAANWAEEKIYEACVQALDQHYTVYHSVDWLQLEKTGQPREGETDFIVTHPDHGVLFVEVKGGQVEFDPETGEWTRLTDRGIREVIKNPVKQAKDGQNWFLRRLTNTLEGAGRGRWTIGYAVAFPQVATKAPLVGVDLPEALILDSRDMRQMAAWVHAAFSFWRGKEPLLRQSQRAMVDHLRRLLARGVSEASQH